MNKFFITIFFFAVTLTFFNRSQEDTHEIVVSDYSMTVPIEVDTKREDQLHKSKNVTVRKIAAISSMDRKLERQYKEKVSEILSSFHQQDIDSGDDFIDFSGAYGTFLDDVLSYYKDNYGGIQGVKMAHDFIFFIDSLNNKEKPILEQHFKLADNMIAIYNMENRDEIKYQAIRKEYKRSQNNLNKLQKKRETSIGVFLDKDYESVIAILNNVNNKFSNSNSSYLSYNVGISI